jgi:hypothetical protein
MAGQARVLRVVTGCGSPAIIAARACPAPARPYWRRPLAAWLVDGQDDGRVRVVTGGLGSGKSAVLARLATLADPLYRERVPDLDPNDPAVPPAGSIEVAVWARNKAIEDVVAAIGQATAVDADSPDGLIDGLLERDQPCTIVVDALDEAVEPADIAGKLLRPLAGDAASAGVRVLIGTRPGREDELVHALGRDAVRFDLINLPIWRGVIWLSSCAADYC